MSDSSSRTMSSPRTGVDVMMLHAKFYAVGDLRTSFNKTIRLHGDRPLYPRTVRNFVMLAPVLLSAGPDTSKLWKPRRSSYGTICSKLRMECGKRFSMFLRLIPNNYHFAFFIIIPLLFNLFSDNTTSFDLTVYSTSFIRFASIFNL